MGNIKAVIIPYAHNEELQKFMLDMGLVWCNGSTTVNPELDPTYNPIVLYVEPKHNGEIAYSDLEWLEKSKSQGNYKMDEIFDLRPYYE